MEDFLHSLGFTRREAVRIGDLCLLPLFFVLTGFGLFAGTCLFILLLRLARII